MTCSNRVTVRVGAFVILLAQACDFSPTTSFSGFDNKGSRLSGTFTSDGGSAARLTAAARTEFDGITVSIRQDSSISTAVKSNGTFSLKGIPQGNVTADFRRDGGGIGAITFHGVRANQEIRIVVALTEDDKVVLVDQERDQVDNGECLARGDGFWCNNLEDFQDLAEAVAEDFAELTIEEDGVEVQFFDLDGDGMVTADDIALAVCLTGNQDGTNQLLRKMATMALNLEADWLDDDGALNAAIDVLEDPDATKADRNAIKDELEALNECGEVDDDGDGTGTVDGCTALDPDKPNKILICHRPPGNPSNEKTLSISASAWPAHEAHGDGCGPCTE